MLIMLKKDREQQRNTLLSVRLVRMCSWEGKKPAEGLVAQHGLQLSLDRTTLAYCQGKQAEAAQQAALVHLMDGVPICKALILPLH